MVVETWHLWKSVVTANKFLIKNHVKILFKVKIDREYMRNRENICQMQ